MEHASKTSRYKASITKALKSIGTYNEGLAVLVNSLADTLCTLAFCRKEIDGLCAPTEHDKTRYGEKLSANPVFKIQKDAQEILLKHCKLLGLTYQDISGLSEEEDSPLTKLYDAMETSDLRV